MCSAESQRVACATHFSVPVHKLPFCPLLNPTFPSSLLFPSPSLPPPFPSSLPFLSPFLSFPSLTFSSLPFPSALPHWRAVWGVVRTHRPADPHPLGCPHCGGLRQQDRPPSGQSPGPPTVGGTVVRMHRPADSQNTARYREASISKTGCFFSFFLVSRRWVALRGAKCGALGLSLSLVGTAVP